MPTLHSHTHCQVAQAETQAKTCQRVSLYQRVADRDEVQINIKMTENKEHQAITCGIKIAGAVLVSRFALLLKFRLP